MSAVTNSCLSWVSTNLWYPCPSLFQLGEPHKGQLLCSARICNMCQKYSIFNYKALLLGFLFFLRHGTEWAICKNPAHVAAGRFPKPPGKSMTGKSQKLLDVRIISVIKLQRAKHQGQKSPRCCFMASLWDVSIMPKAPGKGIFGGGEMQTKNKITQGAAHKKQFELMMLFSNIKKIPPLPPKKKTPQQPSWIFSSLFLSSTLPASGTKECINVFSYRKII